MNRTVQLLRELGWRVLDTREQLVVLEISARDVVRRSRMLIDALQRRQCVIWPCSNKHGMPCMWIEFDPVARDSRLYLVINDAVLFGPETKQGENIK